MSRQSKSAKRLAIAQAFSVARQKGNKGPKKTNPQHGKRWTYRTNPDLAKRVSMF